MDSRAQMGPRTGLARWSWRVGSIAGIETQVHASFLLILLWAGWNAWQVEPSPIAVAVGIAFVLALFACVLLHELGHALTARRFGIATRSITLLPIGGVASLERMPRNGRQELLVAVAGPAVNLVIAGLLFASLMAVGDLAPDTLAAGGGLAFAFMFAEALMWANVALAVFNMIPAFPMDGGRVLRAGLSLRRGRLRATEIAVTVGKVLAVGFGIYGLAGGGSPFLVLIGVFVWFTGERELQAVRREAELERVMAQLRVTPETLAQMRAWMALGHRVVLRTDDGRELHL